MVRGLIIGRFQPFHNGHLAMIQDAAQYLDELIVVIGSGDRAYDLDNPFTAGERVEMVGRALDGLANGRSQPVKVWIVPLDDLNDNSLWAHRVLSRVPRVDVLYSNNAKVLRLFRETAGIKGKPLRMFDRDRFSARMVRDALIHKKPWEEQVPPAVAHFIAERSLQGRLVELFEERRILEGERVQDARDSMRELSEEPLEFEVGIGEAGDTQERRTLRKEEPPPPEAPPTPVQPVTRPRRKGRSRR